MKYEGPRVVVEPVSRMAMWKKLCALGYGLCLTLGVVLVVRGELVDKFDLPLRLCLYPPCSPRFN